MAGISKINRLPKEIQRRISALFDQGFTVSEITERLKDMGEPVSRSSVGRKRREWALISAQVRESREMAEAIVRGCGNESAGIVAAANLEMMHSILNKLIRGFAREEEVSLKPSEIMQLTKALNNLAGGRKSEVGAAIMEEKAAQESAAMAQAQGGEGGVIEIKVVETPARPGEKTPQEGEKAPA
jgi:hypothetical protein